MYVYITHTKNILCIPISVINKILNCQTRVSSILYTYYIINKRGVKKVKNSISSHPIVQYKLSVE